MTNKNSALGSHLRDCENFNHKIDAKSYLGLKFSKNPQSNTANLGILDSNKSENLSRTRPLTELENGSINRRQALFQSPFSTQPPNLTHDARILDFNVSQNAEIKDSVDLRSGIKREATASLLDSFNLKDSSDFAKNCYLMNPHEVRPLGVVGGGRESCEREGGERLRVCAKHRPTLANSSPRPLFQDKINFLPCKKESTESKDLESQNKINNLPFEKDSMESQAKNNNLSLEKESTESKDSESQNKINNLLLEKNFLESKILDSFKNYKDSAESQSKINYSNCKKDSMESKNFKDSTIQTKSQILDSKDSIVFLTPRISVKKEADLDSFLRLQSILRIVANLADSAQSLRISMFKILESYLAKCAKIASWSV